MNTNQKAIAETSNGFEASLIQIIQPPGKSQQFDFGHPDQRSQKRLPSCLGRHRRPEH